MSALRGTEVLGWEAPAPVRSRRPRAVVVGVLAAMIATLALVALSRPWTGAPRPAPAPAAQLGQTGWASVPAVAQLAISRAIGADQSVFHFRGGVAHIPAQDLTARISGGGLRVSVPGGSARLGLMSPLTGRTVQANRLVLGHGPVTEWFANGPLGLEQGFELTRSAPSVLNLAGVGALHARLSAGGSALTLVNRRGHAVLTERDLSATDARGRQLPVRFRALSRGRLAITVDTRGARFPVSVDPFVQAASLSASDGYAYEGDEATVNGNGISAGGLGYAVAIDGQTIAVGAPGADVVTGGSNSYQGAVYVFSEPASGWANATQTAKLEASDGQGAGGSNAYGDALGSSVAISGNTIVAGAPRAVAGGIPYAGKVYVFTEPATGGWVTSFQTAELATSNATADDFFGSAVAYDGQTIVTAVPNREGSGGATSQAFIFDKPSSGGWVSTATPDATLTDPSNSRSGDGFGSALAVSGASIAIGAPFSPSSPTAGDDAGAVYVLTRSGTSWSGTPADTRLAASSPVPNETLGASVALDGTTLVAGAPHNASGNGATPVPGAAYVFNGAGGWSSAVPARLTASDGVVSDAFGRHVAVAGANVWVSGYPSGTQELYGFSEPAGGWTTTTQTSENALANTGAAYSGGGLALQAGTVVAGVPGGSPPGGPQYSGYGLVFTTGTGGTTPPGNTTPSPNPPGSPTPAPTTPAPPAPAPPGAGLTFTAHPVYVDTTTAADIIAGLFGLTPGSGETENLGDFTFVAYCSKPAGQCAASTSFGQQLGTNTAANRVAHAVKRARAVIWGQGAIKIKAKHRGTVVIKLTQLGRRKLTRTHVLKGQIRITVDHISALHTFTLHYKPRPGGGPGIDRGRGRELWLRDSAEVNPRGERTSCASVSPEPAGRSDGPPWRICVPTGMRSPQLTCTRCASTPGRWSSERT